MSAPTTDAPTDAFPPARHAAHGRSSRGSSARLAIPIILGWIAVIAVAQHRRARSWKTVGQMRAVSMSPDDAPSMIAMKRVGQVFEEFNSDSSAMIVLEGEEPLGDDAHTFYDEMVDKLEADTKHVQHVQDFWSDPLTAAGSQSNDGKAAYVQVYLAGNQGEALANESVEAVQNIVDSLQPPAGREGLRHRARGTGRRPAHRRRPKHAADRGGHVHRHHRHAAARLPVDRHGAAHPRHGGARSWPPPAASSPSSGYHEIIGLSTFATNLLVTLAIAAATDYAIFLIGRYQEARGLGEDRESAYYTMFHGTAHVVLGSGLTIAGATFCLQLHQAAVLPDAGRPAGHRHGGRRCSPR